MTFKMKYPIKTDYIDAGTKRRSGAKIQKHLFGVLHDTGNSGSTAANNVSYFKRTAKDISASAHTFIDDKNIIECIPTDEKAWHVLYNVTSDNKLFGDDANDSAIGVELCFGGVINFEESYNRYVWYCAYMSYKYGFDKWIGHEKLDPARKTDPTNALRRYGKTYEQLLTDIKKEYAECTRIEPKPIQKEEEFMLEKAIVIYSFADYPAAEFLANRLQCPIYTRPIAEQKQIAKELYVIGGEKDKLKADKIVLLSGDSRFDTAIKVKEYLKV